MDSELNFKDRFKINDRINYEIFPIKLFSFNLESDRFYYSQQINAENSKFWIEERFIKNQLVV